MEAGTTFDSRFHTAMIRTPRFGLRPLLQSNDPTSTGGQDSPAASGKSATHPLDAVTGGVFSAATSGERAARLRAWLATEPEVAVMQEVFRDLSTRDKGAAKPLREKLDEIKRIRGQEALAAEWQARAEQLLQASRLNIADAMAWQRDAAKAGAPLSKEPLATTRTRLAAAAMSGLSLSARSTSPVSVGSANASHQRAGSIACPGGAAGCAPAKVPGTARSGCT